MTKKIYKYKIIALAFESYSFVKSINLAWSTEYDIFTRGVCIKKLFECGFGVSLDVF